MGAVGAVGGAAAGAAAEMHCCPKPDNPKLCYHLVLQRVSQQGWTKRFECSERHLGVAVVGAAGEGLDWPVSGCSKRRLEGGRVAVGSKTRSAVEVAGERGLGSLRGWYMMRRVAEVGRTRSKGVVVVEGVVGGRDLGGCSTEGG